MTRAATAPGDLYARGLADGEPSGLRVRFTDGRAEPVDLARWLGAVDTADESVVEGVVGPVLDIGCGPGRHVLACARRGIEVLGVDISPAAVAEARRRGAPVIEGCVFSGVPRAGSWGSALLLDGNIGIGGDPALLLARTADLLVPGGQVVVEVGPPGSPTCRDRIRLEIAGAHSAWFPWARVSVDGIGELARAAGLSDRALWEVGGRWFVGLDAAA